MTLPSGSSAMMAIFPGKKKNRCESYCHFFPRATTRTIWATSSSSRKLLSDRKGVLDHLKPQTFFVSTMRVAVIQGSNMFATFLTDQLKMELKREELVDSGKLTPEEADRQNEEWKTRERSRRLNSYPDKFSNAFLKFQAMTFFMRFYEHVFASLVSEEKLDKLTIDTHRAALRTKQDLSNNNNNNSKIEMGRVMLQTCLWGNFVSFLSDWSVHQLILGWTYYVYIQQKRKRTKKENRDSYYTDDYGEEIATTTGNNKEENEENEMGGIFLGFVLKSSRLTVSRVVAWVAASAGGAAGSMVYPGWGTLLGTQSGDALVGAIWD